MGFNVFPAPCFGMGPICFRCYLHGHFSNTCPNAVVCNRCGLAGHKSSTCRANSGWVASGWRTKEPKQLKQNDIALQTIDASDKLLASFRSQLEELKKAVMELNSIQKKHAALQTSSTIESTVKFTLGDSYNQHIVGSNLKLVDTKPCNDFVFVEGKRMMAERKGALIGKGLTLLNVLQVPNIPINIASKHCFEARGARIVTEVNKQKLVVDSSGLFLLVFRFEDGQYVWDASQQFG
jgi:hypothetical protein